MVYWQLFWTMLGIGAGSIGGGYASLSLLNRALVQWHGWLSEAEFADMVIVAEMTPGPLSINLATFTGLKMGGICGGIVATAGCVTAPFVVILLLVKLYARYRQGAVMEGVLSGLRPAAAAAVAAAGLSMAVRGISVDKNMMLWAAVFALGIFLLGNRKLKSQNLILLSGAVGLLQETIMYLNG